ncbi:acetyltransferase (GNAT) family domain-containing protein [Ditylenchus destructor]|uniref:N-terminal methionine N(alpha)-acetyltransferase NatE n=1 Tax=Ditylenchus destructor TaxID=166010 RepID=A0AAD4N793_9BILA|nr:acetyltransferase (GNAT) family domain-containing protein [Ditylenchus destructor]
MSTGKVLQGKENKQVEAEEVTLVREDLESCKIAAENGNRKQATKRRCVGRCDIELGDVSRHNVMQLKRLNMSVFPVSYNDKFYKEVVTAGDLAKLAYFNDIIIGGVCCRVDTVDNQKRLYIMTLGTLAPYRRYGVGTMLLNHVFDLCAKDQQIKSVYLHVQTNNESALDFYKKFGFDITGTVEKYYKRITPDDAYILEKNLE